MEAPKMTSLKNIESLFNSLKCDMMLFCDSDRNETTITEFNTQMKHIERLISDWSLAHYFDKTENETNLLNSWEFEMAQMSMDLNFKSN